MKNILLLSLKITSLIIVSSHFLHAQKIRTANGSLEKLKGILDYNIEFKYVDSDSMRIPKYDSERDFLQFQFNKKEKVQNGLGEKFKEEWFSNRKNLYEPAFIKSFNDFQLKKREVNISTDEESDFTIEITTLLTYPGYYITVYYEHTKLEVVMKIYRTEQKSDILYTSETIKTEAVEGGNTDAIRITAAYENLGRILSKFLHRKT
ncbi:hypothetical protein [Maribacter sp. 2210JD10-5]|uniref:hypothetical protein n=1 Tax=Maribacter sp. 2210JD10-5 TaxID=3386272 RepID=UPI0039BC284D